MPICKELCICFNSDTTKIIDYREIVKNTKFQLKNIRSCKLNKYCFLVKQGDILDETALITNSTKYIFWDYKWVLKPFSLSSETSCVCHMRPSCPGANPFIIHNSNA